MPQLDLGYTSSPTTPSASYSAIYANATGIPKYMDPSGNVHPLGGASNVYDVTSYGVLPSNTASANVSALNTLLQTTAPAGATIYFPGGVYQFNAALTTVSNAFIFQGQGSNNQGGYSNIQLTANLAGNFLTVGNWYTQFNNLIFTTTITQTAGAVVASGSNVGVNFTNCCFAGAASTTLFNCIDYTGANGANQSVVTGCAMSGFTGTGIIVNGSGSSLVVANSVIQGQYGATTANAAAAGISGAWVGALQIIGCDILGAVNNLLISPVNASSNVAASVYCTNTYFDSSSGSCIKISNTGATVRCRFDTCSFTCNTSSPGGYSAVEVSGSYAFTTSATQGLDFTNCSVLNTFGATGTTNGFLINNAADINITNCRIAGWTNGIQITPIATAGVTKPNIQGCVIGPCAGIGANTTGILLNAGSATYGTIQIQDNNLGGNSTQLTDNSLTAAAGQQKIYQGNLGLAFGSAVMVTNVQQNTATEAVLTKLAIPANGLRVGSVIRMKVSGLKTTATACNLTVQGRYGANGTTADTLVVAALATTAATGNQLFDFEQDLYVTTAGASGIIRAATVQVVSTATTPAVMTCINASSSAINLTAAGFLDLCFVTSAAVTQLDIFKASIEVIFQ